MRTKIDTNGEVLIVRLNDELDHHSAAQIREQVDNIVMQGSVRKIVFDFSNVGFMDSSGIGIIMGRFKLMQAIGGEVTAFGFSGQLDKLITMSGIKKIIKIYSEEKDAVKRGVK